MCGRQREAGGVLELPNPCHCFTMWPNLKAVVTMLGGLLPQAMYRLHTSLNSKRGAHLPPAEMCLNPNKKDITT